jgi:hypothetical protein
LGRAANSRGVRSDLPASSEGCRLGVSNLSCGRLNCSSNGERPTSPPARPGR